jgi:hypothetical protein
VTAELLPAGVVAFAWRRLGSFLSWQRSDGQGRIGQDKPGEFSGLGSPWARWAIAANGDDESFDSGWVGRQRDRLAKNSTGSVSSLNDTSIAPQGRSWPCVSRRSMASISVVALKDSKTCTVRNRVMYCTRGTKVRVSRRSSGCRVVEWLSG